MRGEGYFVFEPPARIGPGIANRKGADGAVLRGGLAQNCIITRLSDDEAGLVVPTTTKTQIPAIAGQGGRAECGGGDSRHGEQTELHFSTLAKNIDRQVSPANPIRT